MLILRIDLLRAEVIKKVNKKKGIKELRLAKAIILCRNSSQDSELIRMLLTFLLLEISFKRMGLILRKLKRMYSFSVEK